MSLAARMSTGADAPASRLIGTMRSTSSEGDIVVYLIASGSASRVGVVDAVGTGRIDEEIGTDVLGERRGDRVGRLARGDPAHHRNIAASEGIARGIVVGRRGGFHARSEGRYK